MGDGPRETDLIDVMHALARIERLLAEPPQSTFVPRKSPDERVMEEAHQIDFAIDRLKSHLREGGYLPRGVIPGLLLKLSKIPEHVLTSVEQEAADD